MLVDANGDEVGSIETLSIDELLKLPQFVSVLRDFLTKSQSIENLNFLEMVEIYERLAANPNNPLLPLAQEIYNEFIAPGAVQLVNIDAETHNLLTQVISTGQVDGRLFVRSADSVTKLMHKDVFKRFCLTVEARKLMAESDASTFTKYLKFRDRRLSFSRLQKTEDISFLEALLTKEKDKNPIGTIQLGKQKFPSAIDGKALLNYYLSKQVVPNRAGAYAIAQRLIEAGVIQHVFQPRWNWFQESETYQLTSAYIANLPKKEKWPPVNSLLTGKGNVMNAFLLRGVRYHRLWGVGSLEHGKLFFYRSEACDVPHSCIPLKGATVILESGGENEVEDSSIPGFRAKTATQEKECKPGESSRFRYGQIYMRITTPWEPSHPMTCAPPQLVYMFENPVTRPRWKKFFTDAGVNIQTVVQKGVSVRAVMEVAELHGFRSNVHWGTD